MKRKNENGRSMVEMLGVLAIIGVLSVMGIAGYKAAMTRHRANELLNEATKRATVVAGQLSMMGAAQGSLNEFTQNEFAGGTFKTDPVSTQNGHFDIEVDEVAGDVCQLMQEIAEQNEIIKKFSPKVCDGENNAIQLTYNNDLSTEEADLREDTGSCANGNVYLSYNADPCGTDTPMAGNCKKNSDCAKGEFCNLTEENTATCRKPDTGNCEPIGTLGVDFIDLENIEGLGTVRYRSSALHWWAAENWCKAQNMNLIDISKFQCYQSGSSTLITAGYRNNGGCCAKNMRCAFSRTWYTSTNYSPVIRSLEQQLGHGEIYLLTGSSRYSSATGQMRMIYLADSNVISTCTEKSGGGNYGNRAGQALCQ